MQPPQKATTKSKGNEFFKQGDYSLAANMYRRYLSHPHDDNPAAELNLALCLYKMEQYQESVEHCLNVIEKDPNYLKAYYRIALGYEKLSRMYQAYRYACLFIEKSESEASPSQGQSEADIKEMKALIERCKKIIENPQPIQVDEITKMLLEGGGKQGKDKGDKEDKEGKKVEDWATVQKLIDQGELKLALDVAYGIAMNGRCSGTQWKSNAHRLSLVKQIKEGTLPPTTNITTSKPTPQNTLPAPQTPPSPPSPTTPLSTFTESLEKRLDPFEGFPVVLGELLQSQNIDTFEKIVVESKEQYPMWNVLQMSMTQKQKNELRKQMEQKGIKKEIIQICCE